MNKPGNDPKTDNVSTGLQVVKDPGYDSEDATQDNPEFGLMAIADGLSSDSTLTSFWSSLLVNDFCNLTQSRPCEYLRDKYQDWLNPLQDQWQQAFQKVIDKIRQNKNAKTYNPLSSPRTQRNAKGLATFVGVHVLPADAQGKGKWQAIAIGDSCMFHFRKESNGFDLASSFPLTKSYDFTPRTQAITSKADMSLVGGLNFVEGDYELGDIFFVATDALAKWLLKNREEGKNEWKKLLEIDDQDAFEQMIISLRSQKLIEIDDTTFSRTQVVTSPKEHSRANNLTITQTTNLQSNSLSVSSQVPVIQNNSAQNILPGSNQNISPIISQAQNPNPPPPPLQAVRQTNSIGSINPADVTSQQPITQAVQPNGFIKPQPISKPFWNKEFLQKTAMVAAGVAVLASATYLLLHHGHDVSISHTSHAPSLLPRDVSQLHDTLLQDLQHGALSGESWEHLSNANPVELQALVKHNPTLSYKLHEAINSHLAAQQRASELLDTEKFKAFRESGGVALKNFTPTDEQLTLKFINQTFQKHGLNTNFSLFTEAQQYVSSHSAGQYNSIDTLLVQDPGTAYHQFDQLQHTLNGQNVCNAVLRQWHNQQEGLIRARDTLAKATAFNGSGIKELAERSGGTLNASAGDLFYVPPSQQAFDWGAAASTSLAVTKIAAKGIARGVVFHAFPVVGAAIASYTVSKRTYDHLMTKADKLGILDERQDCTLGDRLCHAPMDLLRVTNSAVKDAPQDFRNMVSRFHHAGKNIVSSIKSFHKTHEREHEDQATDLTLVYKNVSQQKY